MTSSVYVHLRCRAHCMRSIHRCSRSCMADLFIYAQRHTNHGHNCIPTNAMSWISAALLRYYFLPLAWTISSCTARSRIANPSLFSTRKNCSLYVPILIHFHPSLLLHPIPPSILSMSMSTADFYSASPHPPLMRLQSVFSE